MLFLPETLPWITNRTIVKSVTYINGTNGKKIDRVEASTLWDLWVPTEYDTTEALAALDAIESEAIDSHRQADPPAPAPEVASSSTATTPTASGKRPVAAASPAAATSSARGKVSRTK